MDNLSRKQLLDDFVSSLSKIIEIKDDIHYELRYHNYRTASSIRESQYEPEIESLKKTLSVLLSISIDN